MRNKARITSVHAALRRQRLANARTLIKCEGGPCWYNGQIVEPLANDTIIEIVYQAPADAQNVVHLTWGDDPIV